VKTMTQHANRGKYLEDWIEQTNIVYNHKGLAIINKIPTPWKIQRNYSPYTKQYKISGAFPEKKSTVDFGGTASSQSIWFDVKATTHKTSFPLANIYGHQLEYLQKVAEQGGKAFVLIHFTLLKQTWLIWIDQLIKFIGESKRKSIPIDWFEANCEEVKKGTSVMLDYLPIVLRRNDERR
jgi:recombination protein U